jgi:large subunit ribosomal protein L29
MPNPLADEARTLNDDQLAEAVNEAYREHFNLQFQKGTRQLQDGTAIPRSRRQIARLRTLQRERQIAAVLGTPIAPAAAPEEAAISPQKQRALDERAEEEAEEAAAAAELEQAEAAAAADESDDDATDDDAGDDAGSEPENEDATDADGEASAEDASDDDAPDDDAPDDDAKEAE